MFSPWDEVRPSRLPLARPRRRPRDLPIYLLSKVLVADADADADGAPKEGGCCALEPFRHRTTHARLNSLEDSVAA